MVKGSRACNTSLPLPAIVGYLKNLGLLLHVNELLVLEARRTVVHLVFYNSNVLSESHDLRDGDYDLWGKD